MTSTGESSPGGGQTDPSLLAVFYDYIKLMPMVAEANQMSQELKKVTQSVGIGPQRSMEGGREGGRAVFW